MRFVTPALVIMSLAFAASALHIVSLSMAIGTSVLGCFALFILAIQAQLSHRNMLKTGGKQN